MASRK
ncbi:Uncharacterized protein HZ326_30954, partial [Fusarium oxysporum f. sp. albedinis]